MLAPLRRFLRRILFRSFPRLRGDVTFTLESGVELHGLAPETFYLPSAEERTNLRPGDFAKLMFRMTDGEQTAVERMWVLVREVRPDGYVGILDNEPFCTLSIQRGLSLQFHADHVIGIRPAA